jgi:protein-serine/threonine kinase
LGALLYELVIGVPPYYSLNHDEIYNSILNEELSFPSHVAVSDELKSLLKGLLEKNQKKRLGSMFGIKEVLLHPWVGRLKQSAIENKEL